MRALRSLAAWSRRRPDAAAVAVLAAVLCVYFAPLFAGDRLGQSHILYENHPWAAERPAGLTFAPRPDEGDAALHYHPILALARRQLHDGELPLWNPSSYTGMPLLGNMQSALLFPLTWLALTLPVEVAFGWMALLKLLIAGLGAYVLARRLGARPPGALVGALVYALCAPLILWMQHMLGTELALLPWLLVATDRVAGRPDRRGVALLAAVVTLSVFAGHPETAALNSLAAAVLLLVRVARERSGWRAPAGFAAAHVLGALAAAVAIVPFLVGYADSITRVAHDGSALRLPLSWLLTYGLPTVFGSGDPEFWGPVDVVLSGYFGVAAALLAGVGLVGHRRDGRVVALAAAALFMGMLAFDVPPVSWLVGLLPFYESMVALRVVHVVALAGAVAAALGVDALLRRPLPVRAALAWVAGAVAVVALMLVAGLFAGALRAPREVEVEALARFGVAVAAGAACLVALGRLRGPVALALVVAVVVGDLWYLRDHNAILPPEQAYPPSTPGLRFLQAQREPFNVSTIRPVGQRQSVLPPNTPSLYGLQSIQGYDIPQPKRWADFSYFVLGERGPGRTIVWNTPLPRGPALTGLRMLNVRYLLAAPGTPPPDPSLEVAYAQRDLTIFRDPLALPRAYVVGRTQPMRDADALRTLVRGGLDPRREALVPPGAPVLTGPGAPARAARFERLGSGHVRVHLPRGADGWLVVAQSHSRQWDAEADGRAVPTFPTNYAATGLRVTPDMRTVDLRHDRTAEAAGAAVSVLGLLLIAALWLRGSTAARPGPRRAPRP